MTAHECVSDVPSSRLSPALACERRKRRSQSIPAELATPSTGPYSERPAGCIRGLETAAADKVTLIASECAKNKFIKFILFLYFLVCKQYQTAKKH